MDYKELFDDDDLAELELPSQTKPSHNYIYEEKTYVSEEVSKRIVNLMLNVDFRHPFKI